MPVYYCGKTKSAKYEKRIDRIGDNVGLCAGS